ncbi:MAG: flagellar protein [Lachnospiraceae bacterium]|nr:flagellar protein [Lachnospiraceae bacterium]
MNGLGDRIYSIEQATDLLNKNKSIGKNSSIQATSSFQEIFNQQVKASKVNEETVKFSKHANERLESRNINLSTEQMSRLNEGVSKARDKSINDSLVMMDDLAFIVNIKNNIVVTALESNDESNVFTNIDGAVIV